jgi:PhnB protein
MKLNTYIHFTNGKCEEALNFYVKALGAKPLMMVRYSEAPASGPGAPEMADKIMHGRLSLGESVLMASDVPPGRGAAPEGFSINIDVASPEEGGRLFQALAEKAEIRMPYGETFWAKGFGMLVDQFGVPWMVNCEKQG